MLCGFSACSAAAPLSVSSEPAAEGIEPQVVAYLHPQVRLIWMAAGENDSGKRFEAHYYYIRLGTICMLPEFFKDDPVFPWRYN